MIVKISSYQFLAQDIKSNEYIVLCDLFTAVHH